jgi:hypothetical protein
VQTQNEKSGKDIGDKTILFFKKFELALSACQLYE